MRLKFVSRLFLAAVVVLIGTFASANSSNSFNFNTTGGSGYSDAYSYNGYAYLYGATSSSVHGGWNDSWFELVGGTSNGSLGRFTYGYFEDEYGKGNSVGYIWGSLSSIVFNSSLGKLTGLFSGYVELDNNGNWSYTYFTGRWTENVSLTQTYNGYGYQEWYGGNSGGTLTGVPNGFGPSAIGIAQTPEPGSLVLMGTGLLGIAGVVKRKLLYAKSTNL